MKVLHKRIYILLHRITTVGFRQAFRYYVGTKLLRMKNTLLQAIAASFSGKGLEIGGPSEIFSSKGLLPLYEKVGGLDNLSHARVTIWRGNIEGGQTYVFSPQMEPGHQYLSYDELARVPDAQYEFIAASHVIDVFSPDLLIHLFDYLQYEILYVGVELPHHIILSARKTDSGSRSKLSQKNAAFFKADAPWRKQNPFPEK